MRKAVPSVRNCALTKPDCNIWQPQRPKAKNTMTLASPSNLIALYPSRKGWGKKPKPFVTVG